MSQGARATSRISKTPARLSYSPDAGGVPESPGVPPRDASRCAMPARRLLGANPVRVERPAWSHMVCVADRAWKCSAPGRPCAAAPPNNSAAGAVLRRRQAPVVRTARAHEATSGRAARPRTMARRRRQPRGRLSVYRRNACGCTMPPPLPPWHPSLVVADAAARMVLEHCFSLVVFVLTVVVVHRRLCCANLDFVSQALFLLWPLLRSLKCHGIAKYRRRGDLQRAAAAEKKALAPSLRVVQYAHSIKRHQGKATHTHTKKASACLVVWQPTEVQLMPQVSFVVRPECAYHVFIVPHVCPLFVFRERPQTIWVVSSVCVFVAPVSWQFVLYLVAVDCSMFLLSISRASLSCSFVL